MASALPPISQRPAPAQQPVLAPQVNPPAGQIHAAPVSQTVPALNAPTRSDSYQQQTIRPTPPSDINLYRLKHPKLFGMVQQAVQQAAQRPDSQAINNESDNQRMAMFFELYNTLDERGKNSLKALLPTGKLFRAQAEDKHSTLYHLYAMATTPRLNGIDGPRAARDLLSLIDNPDPIVQTFVTLLPQDAQEMLRQFNLHPVDLPDNKQTISALDYLQSYSADCVPAAIMARQAISNYDELARQINEITGLGYFDETVRAQEIWPKNPAEAQAVMDEWQWTYQPKAGEPGAYTVRFTTPESVKIRMVYAHRKDKPGQEQSPIEGGYQGTLAYQGAGKRYNGILGKRWDPTNTLSIGLNAIEKTVLENAIEDGKSIHSVQYQIATGRQGSEADGDSYLFGYTVPFEETQKHLLLTLDMGWNPVVGFIETDNEGRVQMAHEIMIKGYKQVGDQLYFEVIDTDDDNPKTVMRAAKEIIPKIHHASFPFGLAQRIESDINSRFMQFYTPSADDNARYNTIKVSTAPPMEGWEEMVWPEKVEALRQQAEQQAPNEQLFPNKAPAIPQEAKQQPPGSVPSPSVVGVPTRPEANVLQESSPLSQVSTTKPAPATTNTVRPQPLPPLTIDNSGAVYPTPPAMVIKPIPLVTTTQPNNTKLSWPTENGNAFNSEQPVNYPQYRVQLPQ